MNLFDEELELKEDEILELTALGWDEYAVEHFIKCDPIPIGEKVKFKEVIRNFCGTYLRCNYNGKIYDILPKCLKRIKDENLYS